MYIYLEHKIISAQYDTISVSLKSRAEQTATKQATHLKLSDDVHRIGPCHSPPPCRHETINTTLLSLTLKSTREGVSEKSGRGEQESVSARIHPRNTILSAHIHSHNPRARPPIVTRTTYAAARRAPMCTTGGPTCAKQHVKRG